MGSYYMKLWGVPLITPIVDERLEVGTRLLAEQAALKKLKFLGGSGDHWMRSLDHGFYMYGIGNVWTGVISIQHVGAGPG